MCEPTAIIAGAGLAFKAGSAIAGHKAQNKAAEANEAAALRAYHQNRQDLAILQQQEKQAHAVNVFDVERSARAAQAAAAVSAGEAGVTGQSVADILNDLDRQHAEAAIRTERNLDDRLAMLEREKLAGKAVMRDRIASVPRASTFGTVVGVGGALLGFGGTLLDLQRGKAGEVPDPSQAPVAQGLLPPRLG
jgi:hypothetical protein